ncbi:MAG: hypothetical protein EOL91_01125 [Actinobacteria bacterium]|nr:hypothetical protein [Actinomycetota bacterium]
MSQMSMRPAQMVAPTLEKNVTIAFAAPIRSAAPAATRTPDLPRPARWGLPELEPKPHTTAATTSAATQATRPKVSKAPTICRSWARPGRPEPLAMTPGSASGARRNAGMVGRDMVGSCRIGMIYSVGMGSGCWVSRCRGRHLGRGGRRTGRPPCRRG